MKNHLQRSLIAKRESKYIDFKVSLDWSKPGAWCEIVKDMIAMANSGGGVLLIGVDNKGTPTDFDPAPVLDVDEADVTNQILKYTGVQFDAFTISEESKAGSRVVAIIIEAVDTPIVFTKVGTYSDGPKKQKAAFSKGTVYFRHGAKSEPGNTEDLRKVIERQVESIRKSWMQGVRKVVKSPPGSQIHAFAPGVEISDSTSLNAGAIRIVDDPDAPAYRSLDYDDTHPFRQKELIVKINEGLKGKATINAFDIQCVTRIHDIKHKENFCHRPRYGSPQYSRSYVDWVIQQHAQDANFFRTTRDLNSRQRE